MAEEKPEAKPQPALQVRHFRFCIEFGDSRNRNMGWPLDQSIMRGRWMRSNIPDIDLDDQLKAMPDIPGMRLEIDTRAKTATFQDPLDTDEWADVLRRLGKIWKELTKTEVLVKKFQPLEHLEDDEIKSHCYWALRKVHAREARFITEFGKPPTMDEVFAMPGLIFKGAYDQGSEVEHMQEGRKYVQKRHFQDAFPS